MTPLLIISLIVLGAVLLFVLINIIANVIAGFKNKKWKEEHRGGIVAGSPNWTDHINRGERVLNKEQQEAIRAIFGACDELRKNEQEIDVRNFEDELRKQGIVLHKGNREQ